MVKSKIRTIEAIDPNKEVSIGELLASGLRVVEREMERLTVRCSLDEMAPRDHKLLQDYLKILASMPSALREVEKNKKRVLGNDDPSRMSEAELLRNAERAASEMKQKPSKPRDKNCLALPPTETFVPLTDGDTST